jgi:hypothetical protein
LEPNSPAQRSVQAGAQKTIFYQFSNERGRRFMRVIISSAPAQVKTDFPWAARAKAFAKLNLHCSRPPISGGNKPIFKSHHAANYLFAITITASHHRAEYFDGSWASAVCNCFEKISLMRCLFKSSRSSCKLTNSDG